MTTTRTRTLLTGSAIAMLMNAGAAYAQDATIYYETPIIQHGQPVREAVPVITKQPIASFPAGFEAGAPVPATQPTAEDASYLGQPQVQVSGADGSVSYVSGGIGAFEKEWFTSRANDFSLKVSYNDSTGHNLAGVNATLTDSSGAQVLNTTTDGPLLLVNAKPGRYKLTSSYEGQSKTNTFTLSKRTTRVGVTFPSSNPEM